MTIKSILHVEDDEATQGMIHDALEGMAELVQVRTIEQAINELSNRSFCLIILDFTLPDGSGQVLLQELKSLLDKPKVIVISGHELVKNIPGVDIVLTKGRYQLNDFIGYVKDILDN